MTLPASTIAEKEQNQDKQYADGRIFGDEIKIESPNYENALRVFYIKKTLKL